MNWKFPALAFLILFFLTAVYAEPQEVKAGIYILNIGDFDVIRGSYTVDFYLNLSCDTPCEPGNFEFLNGRPETIEKIIDTPTNEFYRVQGKFLSNLDLKNFPFDSHSLAIKLEDKTNARDKIIYVPDKKQSGIDPAVNFVGWSISGFNAEERVHDYSVYNERFSRLVFSINIERIATSSFVKILLPILLILLISFLALLIPFSDIFHLTNRFYINLSAFLAAVFFHTSIASSIPAVGYFTLADKIMIAAYLSLGINMLFTALMFGFERQKSYDKSEKLFRQAMYSVPMLTLLFLFIAFALR